MSKTSALIAVDGLGLVFALAIWADFKEVLLLTRFIYINIRKHERTIDYGQNLHQDFQFELQRLQSFCRCFLQDDGKLDGSIVSELWLREVGDIIGLLRRNYDDYAKLACLRDNTYQKYSPFMNMSNTPKDELGFSLNLEEDDLEPLGWDICPNVWMQNFDRLWQPKSLQALLVRTRLCTERLVGWAPLVMASHPRFRDLLDHPKQRKAFMNSEEAHSLCAVPHLLIREIMNNRPSGINDLVIRNGHLDDSAPGSALSAGHLITSSRRESVLIEYYNLRRPSDTDHPGLGERELMELALLLKASSTSSDLRTLSLRGIVNQVAHRRLAFVFEYPKSTAGQRVDAVSLNAIIREKNSGIIVPLSTRFQIAHTLSKTLAKFHADGWVHKNIRSHSIVFFRPRTGKSSMPSFDSPYLVNFEYARPVGAQTSYSFDADLERNVYRHPARQGPPSEAFNKSHDIYALGVVLLELGLWKPVLEIFKDQNHGRAATDLLPPQEIQQKLLEAAADHLPFSMGKSYAEAVSTCLSGQCSGESEHHDEVMFVRTVVRKVDVAMLQPMAE